MIHVATPLKERTAPAHVIVERLSDCSSPSGAVNSHHDKADTTARFPWH